VKTGVLRRNGTEKTYKKDILTKKWSVALENQEEKTEQ